jgi:hypothetical protein
MPENNWTVTNPGPFHLDKKAIIIPRNWVNNLIHTELGKQFERDTCLGTSLNVLYLGTHIKILKN